MFASGNEKLLTLEELTLNSNVIVKGKIISINSYEKENGRIYSKISFVVSKTLKGEFTKEQILTLTYLGGTVNGITTLVVEFPQFKLDEESILFLHQVEQVKDVQIQYQIVGLSQGKFNLLVKNAQEYVERDKLQDSNLSLGLGKGEIEFSNRSTILLSDFINKINQYIN